MFPEQRPGGDHDQDPQINNGNTGDTYIYNGASVTVKCTDPILTFTNAMVAVIGDTDEYKLRKQAIVQCFYSTIIIPDIFSGM